MNPDAGVLNIKSNALFIIAFSETDVYINVTSLSEFNSVADKIY